MIIDKKTSSKIVSIARNTLDALAVTASLTVITACVALHITGLFSDSLNFAIGRKIDKMMKKNKVENKKENKKTNDDYSDDLSVQSSDFTSDYVYSETLCSDLELKRTESSTKRLNDFITNPKYLYIMGHKSDDGYHINTCSGNTVVVNMGYNYIEQSIEISLDNDVGLGKRCVAIPTDIKIFKIYVTGSVYISQRFTNMIKTTTFIIIEEVELGSLDVWNDKSVTIEILKSYPQLLKLLPDFCNDDEVITALIDSISYWNGQTITQNLPKLSDDQILKAVKKYNAFVNNIKDLRQELFNTILLNNYNILGRFLDGDYSIQDGLIIPHEILFYAIAREPELLSYLKKEHFTKKMMKLLKYLFFKALDRSIKNEFGTNNDSNYYTEQNNQTFNTRVTPLQKIFSGDHMVNDIFGSEIYRNTFVGKNASYVNNNYSICAFLDATYGYDFFPLDIYKQLVKYDLLHKYTYTEDVPHEYYSNIVKNDKTALFRIFNPPLNLIELHMIHHKDHTPFQIYKKLWKKDKKNKIIQDIAINLEYSGYMRLENPTIDQNFLFIKKNPELIGQVKNPSALLIKYSMIKYKLKQLKNSQFKKTLDKMYFESVPTVDIDIFEKIIKNEKLSIVV